MISEISSALSAFTAATNLAKTAFAARDDSLVTGALMTMNDRYIDVQNACMALQEKNFLLTEEVRSLKEKIIQAEKLHSDFNNYQLHITTRGGRVYAEKSSLELAREPIYICANCAAKGERTYLQPKKNGFWLNCTIHGDVPSDMEDKTSENMQKLLEQSANPQGWMR